MVFPPLRTKGLEERLRLVSVPKRILFQSSLRQLTRPSISWHRVPSRSQRSHRRWRSSCDHAWSLYRPACRALSTIGTMYQRQVRREKTASARVAPSVNDAAAVEVATYKSPAMPIASGAGARMTNQDPIVKNDGVSSPANEMR